MKTADHHDRRRMPTLATVAFFCTAATLVGLLVWTVTTRQSMANDLDRLKQELSALQTQSRQMEKSRDQSVQDQDVILRVLQLCRSADDIPEFGGTRIISNLIDRDSVLFHVPAGNHSLDVKTSWKTTETNQSGIDLKTEEGNRSTSKEPLSLDSGERSWSIPLVAEHGYRFLITSSSQKESPIGWELTSNAQEFESVSEFLPLESFRTGGSSWSSRHVVAFPNQAELRLLINPGNPRNDFKQPTPIGRWTKSGRRGGNTIQIKFELAISSDNPAVVSEDGAETLSVLQRQDRLGKYLGDGRYLLKSD
ncbi:MAG: hypothetical protein KDB00_27660 [Planctomycetales bacterium]|nr:hypothetical protein [Planctomycetales bacterium]